MAFGGRSVGYTLGLAVLLVTVVAPHLVGAPAAAVSTSASVRIVFPVEGGTVSTVGTRVQIQVTGFLLDPDVGPCDRSDRGRVQLFLDDGFVKEVSDANTSLAPIPASATKLGARLVCTDGVGFDPPVWHNVSIRVGPPEIRILEPGPGAPVSALGFRLRVAVSNFTLDGSTIGSTGVPGTGHVQVTSGASLLARAASETIRITGLASGNVTLRAELRHNNLTALRPAVFAEVLAKVELPSIVLNAPESIVVGGALDLTWDVAGFVLDRASIGGPPEPGRGHVHVFVDGGLAAVTTATNLRIDGLAFGAHTVRVELRNNDHTPLALPIADEARVVVRGASVQPSGLWATDPLILVALILQAAIIVALVRGIRRTRRRRPGTGKTERRRR